MACSSGGPRAGLDLLDVAFGYCRLTLPHNPHLALLPREVTAGTSKHFCRSLYFSIRFVDENIKTASRLCIYHNDYRHMRAYQIRVVRLM